MFVRVSYEFGAACDLDRAAVAQYHKMPGTWISYPGAIAEGGGVRSGWQTAALTYVRSRVEGVQMAGQVALSSLPGTRYHSWSAI